MGVTLGEGTVLNGVTLGEGTVFHSAGGILKDAVQVLAPQPAVGPERVYILRNVLLKHVGVSVHQTSFPRRRRGPASQSKLTYCRMSPTARETPQ